MKVFLGPDTVKRGINFIMAKILFEVSFAVLWSRIGTQSTSKRPNPGDCQALTKKDGLIASISHV